ncbi:MAG: hypothetical protein J2P35_02050 [Actinobacteria bacterium]|nr:hypothetical protein [Actinomycetota bacterium]MBO0787759.1 hypothetical protein [Actinomycetota bacterium]
MVAAGRSVVAAAAAGGIAVRLIGGVAIWLRSSPAARAALGRDYPDIDVVAHRRQSRALRALLEEAGFEPERVFNATHGARRLLYHGPGGWQVDVFLDTFEMSHTLDLGARLEAEPETLAVAELLLTKLQIAEVNAKDLADTAMLLWDHEPADTDGPGRFDLARLTGTCGADWGLYTTVTDNLRATAGALGALPAAAGDRERIAGRIEAMLAGLLAAPKTAGWRLRARVGRRMRWYQLPEEVTR